MEILTRFSESEELMINSFSFLRSVDLVGPPAKGKGLVRIIYQLWLSTQFREIYVLSENLINLLKRSKAHLADATPNDFALREANLKAD